MFALSFIAVLWPSPQTLPILRSREPPSAFLSPLLDLSVRTEQGVMRVISG